MNKIKIPKLEVPQITETGYFESIANGTKVKPLDKPCGDCAISTGFYTLYAEALSRQSKELQEKVADTWYCHNACNRGCAGLRKFLNQPSDTIGKETKSWETK